MIALPILIPLLIILLLLLTPRNKNRKIIAVTGAIILLIIAICLFIKVQQEDILVMQAGGWKSPFGISLVIDLFSAIMLLISGIIGFCVAVFAVGSIDENRQTHHFYVFFFAVLLGVNGTFITGDIFNLYVWFEVMLMASFALITLGSEEQQLEGAIKYVTMNLISSFFFLAGAGLIYGETGTLNMAHLADILRDQDSTLMNTSAMLFFVAFGIKAAVFPFFYWLPASYHTPPIAVTALFSGLLTKVGIYSMIRFFTLFFIHNTAFWHTLLLIAAGATMLVGVLMAASQNDIRKILSFHIISQIGYIIMGLGLFSPLAIAGTIYFIFHNVMAKTNTFLAGGMIHKLRGSYHLKALGGLYKERPLLALLFFIPAMALAGIPPLSGFFAKYILIKAGLESEQYIVTAVALIVSLITLFSMIKIWNKAFWRAHPDNTEKTTQKLTFVLVMPSIILAIITVALGLGAGLVVEVSLEASARLLNPTLYIDAVLGLPHESGH